MSLEIKPCSLKNVRELQAISIETFTETFKEQNTAENLAAYLEKAYPLDALEQELSTTASRFFFVYWKKKIAGYLKVNTDSAQTESMGSSALEIERIYVKKEFHRLSLGKALLDKAFELAFAEKMTAIWLGVWEENKNAIGFYQNKGFVQTGAHPFFMGDDEQVDLIMTKTLD